ncbi:MAG: hypothetical protein OEW06_16590, partial [Gemmatimonadota bacterium]|nr:hypothetical protein [Gemmatimonadota bacterium]
EAIERHAVALAATGELDRRRQARMARHTREVVDRALRHLVWEEGHGEEALQQGLARLAAGTASPYELAREILAGVKKEIGNGHA